MPWGLTLGGQQVVEPAEANKHRRNEGVECVLFAIVVGSHLAWLWRRTTPSEA